MVLCTHVSQRLLLTSTSGWLHQRNSRTPHFWSSAVAFWEQGLVGWLIDWVWFTALWVWLIWCSCHLIDWTAIWLLLVDWLILSGILMLGDWLILFLCQLIGFGSGSCPLFDWLIGWLCPLVVWLVLCIWLNAKCWQNLSANRFASFLSIIYDLVPKGVHENRTKGGENKVDDTLKLVVFLECAQC